MVNAMSIDPQEILAFKATLSRTSAEVIQKHLNDGAILRSWKRNLAEEEVSRRTRSNNATALSVKLVGFDRHKTAEMMSWFISAFLIACTSAATMGTAIRIFGN